MELYELNIDDYVLCIDKVCSMGNRGDCSLREVPGKITSIREDGLAIRCNGRKYGCRFDDFIRVDNHSEE